MYFPRAACVFATVMSFSFFSLSSPLEPAAEIEVQKRQIPGLADVTGVLDEGRALLDTLIPEILAVPFQGSIEETDLPPLVADVVQVINNITMGLMGLGLPFGSVTTDDTLTDLTTGIINDVVSMADNLQNNAVIANIGTLLQPLDIALNGWMAILFAIVPDLLDDVISFLDAGPLVSELMSLGFELVLLVLGLLTI